MKNIIQRWQWLEWWEKILVVVTAPIWIPFLAVGLVLVGVAVGITCALDLFVD